LIAVIPVNPPAKWRSNDVTEIPSRPGARNASWNAGLPPLIPASQLPRRIRLGANDLEGKKRCYPNHKCSETVEVHEWHVKEVLVLRMNIPLLF